MGYDNGCPPLPKVFAQVLCPLPRSFPPLTEDLPMLLLNGAILLYFLIPILLHFPPLFPLLFYGCSEVTHTWFAPEMYIWLWGSNPAVPLGNILDLYAGPCIELEVSGLWGRCFATESFPLTHFLFLVLYLLFSMKAPVLLALHAPSPCCSPARVCHLPTCILLYFLNLTPFRTEAPGGRQHPFLLYSFLNQFPLPCFFSTSLSLLPS